MQRFAPFVCLYIVKPNFYDYETRNQEPSFEPYGLFGSANANGLLWLALR